MKANAHTTTTKTNQIGGCPVCSRPVLEEHVFCSKCEANMNIMPPPCATIYEFPTGKIIQPVKKHLTSKKK